jgi:CheY-like chemotaxis protein
LPDPASGSSARYEAVQVEQAIWEVIHLETILLVDDEPTVLNLCQRILRVGGYNVIAAESGVDALRRMQNSAQTIDLALLDLMMPGMNGIELARHVQNGNPGVPAHDRLWSRGDCTSGPRQPISNHLEAV